MTGYISVVKHWPWHLLALGSIPAPPKKTNKQCTTTHPSYSHVHRKVQLCKLGPSFLWALLEPNHISPTF